MTDIGILLFIISVVSFFVGLIVMIILSVLRKPLRPAAIILLGSALLFLVSFTLCSGIL